MRLASRGLTAGTGIFQSKNRTHSTVGGGDAGGGGCPQHPGAQQTKASKPGSKGTISLMLPPASLLPVTTRSRRAPRGWQGMATRSSTTPEHGGQPYLKEQQDTGPGPQGSVGPGTAGRIWRIRRPVLQRRDPGRCSCRPPISHIHVPRGSRCQGSHGAPGPHSALQPARGSVDGAEEPSKGRQRTIPHLGSAECLRVGSTRSDCTAGEDESTDPQFRGVQVFFFQTLLKSSPEAHLRHPHKANRVRSTGHYRSQSPPKSWPTPSEPEACVKGQRRLSDRKGHRSRDPDLALGSHLEPRLYKTH